MLKKALVTLCALNLMMSLGGCTSKKSTSEEPTADVSEVADESAVSEDGSSGSGDAGSGGGDELSADEQLADDGSLDNVGGDDFGTPAENLAEEDKPPGSADAPKDEVAAAEPPATTEPAPEGASEPPPPAVEEPSAAVPEPSGMPEDQKKSSAPLRKIADAAYEQGGVVVNAVYLARQGDSLDSIATKIYGTADRKKELVKINPTLKSRDVKVGDKVYYNSPQRPTDKSKMLTYYEDMGLAPETYVVAKSENIREVAKKLLGDTNSWKEIWATNFDLESKGELAEGTQLRYWSATAASAPPVHEMAANAPPPPTEPPPVEPPPPVPDQQNQAGAPPATAAIEPPPPPTEPPPVEPPPPPPPSAEPPAAVAGGQQAPSSEGGVLGFLESQDQTMALGAGAILLLGSVALFIMIRKRKARRQIDFHTSTQTQIE